MSFVVTLAAARGAGTVGGKAASLGELTRAGVAVPPGFAVTVDGFTAAMDALDPGGALRAEVSRLDAADLAGIAAAGARLRALVGGAGPPAEVAAAVIAAYAALGGGSGGSGGSADGADVAVRSSATVEDSAGASFAGLQDTYLGIRGAPAVLEHVARCWASLFNDESLTYRRRLGMDEAGVAMAVVVQTMVAPRAAGVLFTRSPVTGDRSVVAIEGTWGLGSALVSGDVTPDSWVISKITGEITTRRVSPKIKTHRYVPNGFGFSPSHAAVSLPGDGVVIAETPAELRDAPCLTDDEIRALAATARRVEAHYGRPQDIEWAVLDGESAPDGRIVLLQSRPETVWAARETGPAGAPRARAADHVLALFGKQTRWT
ncbi:MAG TPA: PEP/pyruvate-binding domain-containing protein [Trebonia sp.]|nr:PEP/pyruvate-binding domain-containing protein [Trebonia sp.]